VSQPVPQPDFLPNTCQVDFLIDLLETAVEISPNRAIAPQWLRLAFHDAGTFDLRVPEGGANGCLLNFDEMRFENENQNLDLAVETLRFIQNRMADAEAPELQARISSADLIQFAGFFVAVRQRGTTPGLNLQKRNELRDTFKWGRPDELNCQTRWTRNLPGFELGADPENIPLRCLFAGREIREKMMDRNGFTAREATALIGAHTIGLTRNHFGPDLAGPWVENGADDATPQGPIFDNAYHKFLIDTIPATTVEEFSVAPGPPPPFDITFPTWFRVTSANLNHLDTDIALAFPSQDTKVHPHYDSFTQEFAESNTEFINSFMAALDKMSKLGVRAPLSPARLCTLSIARPQRPAPGPPVPAPTSAPTVVIEDFSEGLLLSVTVAEDRLEETLVERQDDIEFLTTEVNATGR
jgi:Peroxidase